MRGQIQYWNEQKGFGFIVTKTATFYFHAKNFSGQPVLGARVRFDVGPSRMPNKPPMAINVASVETNALAHASRVLGGDGVIAGFEEALKNAGGTQ